MTLCASATRAQSFPENLGIRLRLEIVSKINTYMYDIFLKDAVVCQLNYLQLHDNGRWKMLKCGNQSMETEVQSAACQCLVHAFFHNCVL